jgi:hypothetical protein
VARFLRAAPGRGVESGVSSSTTLSDPSDVLDRIKRGLAGYVSYLAACEMNQSFSEYILYEPILRILTARGYLVNFEVECPGIAQPRNGDKKRLDLVATCRSSVFAMEVKWKKERSLAPGGDLAKLKAYLIRILNRERSCASLAAKATSTPSRSKDARNSVPRCMPTFERPNSVAEFSN